jgi:hypothetical protein
MAGTYKTDPRAEKRSQAEAPESNERFVTLVSFVFLSEPEWRLGLPNAAYQAQPLHRPPWCESDAVPIHRGSVDLIPAEPRPPAERGLNAAHVIIESGQFLSIGRKRGSVLHPPAGGDLAARPSRPMVTVLAWSPLTKGERPR